MCWYPQKLLFHSEISGEESLGTEVEYSTSCTSALASLELALLNWTEADHLGHWPPTFLAPQTGLMENNFSTDQRWGMGMASGWVKDIIYLLCTWFLLSLNQLHLRSSGIRSWRLETPDLGYQLASPLVSPLSVCPLSLNKSFSIQPFHKKTCWPRVEVRVKRIHPPTEPRLAKVLWKLNERSNV